MQGDGQGMFSIRDANTGEVLWQYDIRAGAIGAPVTYLVDGEQYISLAVGWGGSMGQVAKAFDRLHPGTLYTWKINGDAKPPTKLPATSSPITQLTTNATDLSIGRGFDTFLNMCALCHELGGGGGAVPDLTRSPDAVFDLYNNILMDGALASQGMPSFAHVLNEQDVADLRAYVLFHAAELRSGTDLVTLFGKLGALQYQADAVKEAQRKESK